MIVIILLLCVCDFEFCFYCYDIDSACVHVLNVLSLPPLTSFLSLSLSLPLGLCSQTHSYI